MLRTAHGYSTRYVRKVRWHGHGWPPGVAQIGNVISWRDEAFEFIAHKEVHIAPQLCALCDDEPSKMHFGRGAQVGLLVALRHRKLGRVVVVVTTHLTSNFMEPVCQIAQAEVVMLAAAEFAKEHGWPELMRRVREGTRSTNRLAANCLGRYIKATKRAQRRQRREAKKQRDSDQENQEGGN